jgi:hypothetical protein
LGVLIDRMLSAKEFSPQTPHYHTMTTSSRVLSVLHRRKINSYFLYGLPPFFSSNKMVTGAQHSTTGFGCLEVSSVSHFVVCPVLGQGASLWAHKVNPAVRRQWRKGAREICHHHSISSESHVRSPMAN